MHINKRAHAPLLGGSPEGFMNSPVLLAAASKMAAYRAQDTRRLLSPDDHSILAHTAAGLQHIAIHVCWSEYAWFDCDLNQLLHLQSLVQC